MFNFKVSGSFWIISGHPSFIQSCVYKICLVLSLIHKPTGSITFPSDITASKGKMSIYSRSLSLVRELACVFVNVCPVFACLILAVGIIPVLVRLWSLAFPCTASACGVARLLPVCVRGSLAWFIGSWHTTLWTPPLLLEWLSHVLVVDPPGWFSTDGGQMWSCSWAPGERALQTVWRVCLQKMCL